MDKTCETCKHRGDDPVEYGQSHHEGRTQPITYYECMRITHDDEWGFRPGRQAVVIDGSGYMAVFCVEKTFGCTLWAPK